MSMVMKVILRTAAASSSSLTKDIKIKLANPMICATGITVSTMPVMSMYDMCL